MGTRKTSYRPLWSAPNPQNFWKFREQSWQLSAMCRNRRRVGPLHRGVWGHYALRHRAVVSLRRSRAIEIAFYLEGDQVHWPYVTESKAYPKQVHRSGYNLAHL